MIIFNKMEQLLCFSICFLSNVLIINYLPNYTKTRQNDGSTPVVYIVLVRNKNFSKL